MASNMKEWALWYAGMGLAVFPVQARGKAPLTPHGCKDAATVRKQIEVWWDRWPEANIGIATGSGLMVVDVDSHEADGKASMKEWEAVNGKLPMTWISRTGGGGLHVFFQTDEAVRNRAGVLPGVDIRGVGGLIVAPPSIHESGKRYEWIKSPREQALAVAPDTLIELCMGRKKALEAPKEVIPEGTRTNTLVSLIGSLKSRGMDNEAIRAAIIVENERKCQPPLTENELEKTVFPAIGRGWKTERPYTAVPDKGAFRPQKKKKEIELMDASELLSADLPPILFLVEGLASQGLGGLSAKSKLGKSWLALQLAVAVALGDKFLGFTTKQSSVLYIDLENAPALTQERLQAVLDGRDLPKGRLAFVHDSPLMGEGFEDELIKTLDKHKDIKLVIIDVFQKIKQGKKPNQTDYEADYEILSQLKQIADKYSICIMPIYHDRKFVDPTDPFGNVLGSTAVQGVSDFMWVLYKDKREDLEATLAMTGRTIRETSYKLKREGVKWKNLGNATAVEETRKKQEYDRDPLVNTIRKLVHQNGGKWRGRVKEIISSSQYFKGFRIYDSPQKVGRKIKDIEKKLEEYDAIHHLEMPHGNSGSEHVFESENPFGEKEVLK